MKLPSIGAQYVLSGITKTLAVSASGIIVLGWLDPEELGLWQSIFVFVGYLQILSLGTSSGLNREISFYLGRDERKVAMEKLSAIGFYITRLTAFLYLLLSLLCLVFYLTNAYEYNLILLVFFGFGIGITQLYTIFLQSTFRSMESFQLLSKIQLFHSALYFILLPMIYFFDLYGYVLYLSTIHLSLAVALTVFRPFRVRYEYKLSEVIEVVKVGFPMYLWNYLSMVSRSIPRLSLVAFTGPLTVGLFSPAGTVNNAMMALPNYIGSYLFPKMSGEYGRSGSKQAVSNIVHSALLKIGPLMLVLAIFISSLIPYPIEYFFPKYSNGIVAAKIIVFSGVFLCLSNIIHNAFNSMKSFRQFRLLVSLRFFYVILSIGFGSLIYDNWLITVPLGMVIAEFLNFLTYLFIFNSIVGSAKKSE